MISSLESFSAVDGLKTGAGPRFGLISCSHSKTGTGSPFKPEWGMVAQHIISMEPNFISLGRVARVLDRADITNIVGCPVLAFCARAGTMLPISWGVLCPTVCIVLAVRFIWTLSVERTSDEDYVSGSGCVKASLQAPVVPALAQNPRAGHPLYCRCQQDQKAGPPADQSKASGAIPATSASAASISLQTSSTLFREPIRFPKRCSFVLSRFSIAARNGSAFVPRGHLP